MIGRRVGCPEPVRPRRVTTSRHQVAAELGEHVVAAAMPVRVIGQRSAYRGNSAVTSSRPGPPLRVRCKFSAIGAIGAGPAGSRLPPSQPARPLRRRRLEPHLDEARLAGYDRPAEVRDEPAELDRRDLLGQEGFQPLGDRIEVARRRRKRPAAPGVADSKSRVERVSRPSAA